LRPLYREDVRRELDLEAESRSLGIARYNRERPMPWSGENSSADEEANLPPGQHLLRLAIKPAAEAITAWVEGANSGKAGKRHSAVKWLENARPEEVAYLTARTVLNMAAVRATLQSTAIQAATAIIDHVDMVTFRGKNPAGYAGLIRKGRRARTSARRLNAIRKMLEGEDSRTSIPKAEKLRLGMIVVELFLDSTGLFELDTRPRGAGMGYYLRPSEAVSQWLSRQHDRSALLEPLLLPMVVRPRRWRSHRVGGYLRRLPNHPLVKRWDAKYLQLLDAADLSKVYEAVNHIQETPWRINSKVFDVMRELWDNGGTLGGLPPRDDQPLPGKPIDFDTDEAARTEWKRRAATIHEANAQLFSQRLQTQQRLWIAGKFVDEAAIWFPHALDFRGRVYPMPATAIHPQADDGGKALLEFAHGLPLGTSGAYWLAVHIANLFGVDKVSFKERVEWTYAHSRQLIDSALAPLDGEKFWLTADSPWMALASAFEFAAYLDEGDTYVSRLPIPLDGSNSGLQHFSALLRDPVGARAVNLIPGEAPSDVYEEVASRTQKRIDNDQRPEAAVWRGGKVTRSIAKRPTMTYVYSATRYGMQDMVLQTLNELDAESAEPYLGGADNYAAAHYLSYILFDAVGEVVAAATSAMEWLRQVAKVATNADVPLAWTTPDGFPVLQDYHTNYGERVEVHWKATVLKLTLSFEGSSLDGRGQANGIAPNYVHSLDAAHLRALARAAKAAGIDYLGVIHDSFATHAGRTDELARLLRDTFVEQYEPNLLARFRDEVAATMPEVWQAALPPVPTEGTLDLEEVRRSPYLFA
jgi:DNA-directed RNA polymerase